MFSAVLGLFSQDLAVDLGTSQTRIYQRGAGTVLAEPTVVAVHTQASGRRRVLAVGEQARPMLGRTPDDINAVRPIREGQIQEYEVAEALLLHLVRRVHGRNGWMSPRMVVTVPALATEMERRAVRECCESVGSREVHLITKPLAAALGADLPVHEPSGHMIVDVGGGATEVSVLSLSGVVACQVVPGGGEGMDHAIINYLRDNHSLLVGQPTAEALKIRLGTATQGDASERMKVKGRCLCTGLPRAVDINSIALHAALSAQVHAIGHTIQRVLERTPPELASDIVDHGVVLTGAGSLLRELDNALRHQTGLPVIRAEDPANAVISGAGLALERSDLLAAISC